MGAAIHQDLGAGFIAEASYMFSRGIHLFRPVDVRPYSVIGKSPFTGQPIVNATGLGCYTIPGVPPAAYNFRRPDMA